MPPTPPQIDPDVIPAPESPAAPTPQPASADAPVSFVPHEASGAMSQPPAKIYTGRYGELEAHELVKLLSSLDDERARGRFRESVYISIFVWLAIAWLVFYGPRYLWHAPTLTLPSDILKQRELTQLNAPALHHTIAPANKPSPKPALDNHTLEKLREMSRRTPPSPAPVPTPNPTTPTTAPTLPQPTPPTPVPTHAPPVVAEAPLPQSKPQSSTQPKPNFNNPGSGLGNIAAMPRGGGTSGGDIPTPKGATAGDGAEVLSDTQGVDFDPYIRRLKRDLTNAWIPLLPEETEPPLLKGGITVIILTILPDGTIGDMKLEGSTHDMAIDKAAWGSIVSQGKLPPLPSQFHGPNLIMRWTYGINMRIQ